MTGEVKFACLINFHRSIEDLDNDLRMWKYRKVFCVTRKNVTFGWGRKNTGKVICYWFCHKNSIFFPLSSHEYFSYSDCFIRLLLFEPVRTFRLAFFFVRSRCHKAKAVLSVSFSFQTLRFFFIPPNHFSLPKVFALFCSYACLPKQKRCSFLLPNFCLWLFLLHQLCLLPSLTQSAK